MLALGALGPLAMLAAVMLKIPAPTTLGEVPVFPLLEWVRLTSH